MKVVTSDGPLLARQLWKMLASLVKALLNALGSFMYVCKEEILSLVTELPRTLRLYVVEQMLIEKFAGEIQQLVANVYYSGFLMRMNIELITVFLDLCFNIGWGNLYRGADSPLPTLLDCAKSKSFFGARSLFNQSDGSPEFAQTERKVGIAVSQLTFPGGDSGRRLLEELESKLRPKGKGKGSPPAGAYMEYQNDSYAVMHLTTENILHLLLALGSSTQTEVLAYISRLTALETRNEQSLILQQSLILSELAAWYCHAAMERLSREPVRGLEGKGKLWLLNEYPIVAIVVRFSTCRLREPLPTSSCSTSSAASHCNSPSATLSSRFPLVLPITLPHLPFCAIPSTPNRSHD